MKVNSDLYGEVKVLDESATHYEVEVVDGLSTSIEIIGKEDCRRIN